MAELDRVLGLMDMIDAQVGSLYRPGARHRPYSPGEVVMGLVESQLAGGDFLCDIDHRRADTAGAELRAVAHPPASTTMGSLARRFGEEQLAGLEAADAVLVARAFEVLPEPERARLRSVRPSIDLDPTDVEVYGKKKRGMAFNYAGQRCGRPHPAVWAEAGWVLAADLGSGVDDPRPQAPALIARSVAALPVGLGRPIIGQTRGSSTQASPKRLLARERTSQSRPNATRRYGRRSGPWPMTPGCRRSPWPAPRWRSVGTIRPAGRHRPGPLSGACG